VLIDSLGAPEEILPEAANGWWDIRDKGNKLELKFRWRDPNLQVITSQANQPFP
jgi:hypothetical protein